MTFKGNAWKTYDGMNGNVRKWCGLPVLQDKEPDNDWLLAEVEYPYDANKRTLNAKFTRKLVGSSQKDYTFKLNTEYEYKIVAGVWDWAEENNEWKGGESPSGQYLTLYTATFDKAYALTAGVLAAIGLISSSI